MHFGQHGHGNVLCIFSKTKLRKLRKLSNSLAPHKRSCPQYVGAFELFFYFDHLKNNAVVVFLIDLTIVFWFSLRFFLGKFALHAIIHSRSPIIDMLKKLLSWLFIWACSFIWKLSRYFSGQVFFPADFLHLLWDIRQDSVPFLFCIWVSCSCFYVIRFFVDKF